MTTVFDELLEIAQTNADRHPLDPYHRGYLGGVLAAMECITAPQELDPETQERIKARLLDIAIAGRTPQE